MIPASVASIAPSKPNLSITMRAPDAPDRERAGVGGREECEGAPAVRVSAAA